MLSVLAFFIWVMIAPRSLAFITPYIEKELSSISPKFSVKIEKSLIKWDDKQHVITVHATNVDILNDTNDIVSTLPEISFGFSALRLLKGHLLSSDLTILQPSIYINTASKTLYATPENDSSVKGIALSSIYETIKSNSTSFNLHSVRVQDAKFFISTGTRDMLWKVDYGYARLDSIKGKNQIKSEFKVNFGKDNAYFALNITNEGEKTINTEIKFTDLPSYMLDDLFPDYGIDQKLDMIFSGQSNLLIADDGTISQIRLKLDNASGSVNLPEFFKDIIPIKNLTLDATLHDGFSSLTINNIELDLHGPIVKLSGNINNSKVWPEILPSIEATASVTNLDVSELKNYWPYNFGHLAWEWVTTNIKEGVVTNATGKFKFSSEDIANIIKHKTSPDKPTDPPISDDAIYAIINVENAKVTYMEHFPHAENVKASVKFTGQTMDAAVESAKMLNTNISNAHVKFDQLWNHHLVIGISGDFVGIAPDLIQFLKASYSEKPANAEMASIYNMTGDATGNIDLTIPIIIGLKYSDIDIKITANVKNAVLTGLINGKNLSDGNFDFLMDKYDIHVKGDSLINNIPAKIDFSKNFSGTADYDTKLKLKGSFSPADIKELGLAEIPFITGKMGLDIDAVIKNDETTVTGTADLTQSAVLIENIGFEKLPGKNGSVNFNIIKTGRHALNIKDFKLHGDNFTLAGNAKIDMIIKVPDELILATAKFGTSDFSAVYKSSASSDTLTITGKSLDLSKAKINEWFRKDPGKIKKTLTFNATLANVLMKNGEVLKEFKSDLNCSVEMCKTGNLYGKLRDSNFVVISLKKIGDRSALLVESDNAGAVINAMNISKNITGGHLNIDSTLGSSNKTTVAHGVIKIFDFTAARTPLLGKILTLASFRGIVDLLNNEGISFKKFEAPFTLADGVITVTNAKSSGASIGITAEGTINTAKDEVDLKGVIVPAYAVNNILGKIPFIGKLIIGKENEGILATKYSIRGSYDDAKVSVNPLSILTPGFLRNVFDIFD